MKSFVIYNGSLMPEEELLISPLNRGMMYGDGCFDTLRSYQGKFLKLEEHFERFIGAANYLGIEAHFGFEDFKYKLLELLEACDLMNNDALVRVQCWREGDRGYATNSSNAHWITTCSTITPSKEAISLSIVSTRAIPSTALERKFKLSNGLNYILAAKEAKESGSDDALMLTMHGKISETTVANVFWVKGNTVYTPSVDCDLLPGITRNLVMELIKESFDFVLKTSEFEVADMKQAEAVFVTNSIREIIAVESIDDLRFDVNHTAIKLIKQKFEALKLINLR